MAASIMDRYRVSDEHRDYRVKFFSHKIITTDTLDRRSMSRWIESARKHSCLIVQLTCAEHVPAILRDFLMTPVYTFVGVWNNSHALWLQQCRHSFTMAWQPADLILLVQRMQNANLEVIIQELGFEGFRLEEREVYVTEFLGNISAVLIHQLIINGSCADRITPHRYLTQFACRFLETFGVVIQSPDISLSAYRRILKLLGL
ncbi:hypothetical protein CRG98_031536 [Punica granatum]|uniref:Uncharacterized protein n=1 Tax=Punica granatum TaxID=22663 RepID=A0A2I0IVR7_PUNGR|nr:hypothetical protein CRG98_031536 [Punica granatum]